MLGGCKVNHMAAAARYSLCESSILQRAHLNADTGRLQLLFARDFYRRIELPGDDNLYAVPTRRIREP